MTATDAALLTGFRLRTTERNLGVYGIHLYREGHEPLEHRFRNDDPVHLWSGSKTFTAVAVGMAQAEGLLDLEDPVTRFFPGQAHADGVEAMTVRHLLQMTSGNTFTWWGPGQAEETDLLAGFLRAELVAEPGTRFEYSNGCSYVLSRIIHAVSGEDLRDFLLPRLFVPLGIGNPQWMRCPRGLQPGRGGAAPAHERVRTAGPPASAGGSVGRCTAGPGRLRGAHAHRPRGQLELLPGPRLPRRLRLPGVGLHARRRVAG
ncbi:beta-lactamase family protein [Georgenia satyanarayanai]|uniref:serine hydrolase domain-containing protein n=1 Tax=Georgenia satyanarayanai TaxID=860221 RepID=UPI0020412A56|nr:serine hydrolase [Georgenia satyanarayanai]MCM3659954.1 beta-lactamase family protein [Georgenia satyanarayanai]